MMSEKEQVPEGYKKTELGVILEDWEIEKIKIQLSFPEEQISENDKKLLEGMI